MKIAVISSGNIPSQWAHSINTMKHAQGFYRLNHQVEVLTVQGIKELVMRLKLGEIHDFYGINKKITIHFFNDNFLLFFKKVRILGAFVSQILRWFPKLKELLDPEKKISIYCKKNEIDLAYCRAYRATYFSILNKIPCLLESHTILTKNPDLQNLLNLGKNKFFIGLVTIHENLKENFINEGFPANKIIVLEDAVELEKFDKITQNKINLRQNLGLPLDKKIIMYCGSLKPGKGIRKILETAKFFDNDVLFYIVGGSIRNLKYWKKIAKQDKLSNVVFTGFVKNKFIPYYLKSADVLLMLYDPDEREKIMDIDTTSPLKLFEYMASKNPIVSSRIPTIEKIIKHNQDGLLPELEDIDDIVQNIFLLLEDDILASKLAKNAYEKVKEFTYKERCRKIIENFVNK